MANDKLIIIAQKLLEQSRQDKVKWLDTAQEDKFFVAYPGDSVAISSTMEEG